MGFLSKLFGDKKSSNEEGKPIETTLDYLPVLIEKDFFTQQKGLEELIAKKIAEIKYLHSKTTNLVKDIEKKELESKPNERFNKAAATSKAQLEQQLKRLLEKIDPTNRAKTLEDAKAYSGEGYVLLLKEINLFRKNISYTSFYLKEEMKTLGESLQEIMNALFELNKAFDENKAFFEFEKTKERIVLAQKLLKEIKSNEKEKTLVEEELAGQEETISNQKKKIDSFISGEGMLELKGLEEEKAKLLQQKHEIKMEISSLLSTIDRPLQRFKQLTDSGRWIMPKEEKNYLDSLTVNPLLALKSDPKAVTLKKILGEIKKAVEEEKIDLKDKEREKRLAALDELMAFNFFEKVFWRMNEIQKRQSEIDGLLENSPAKKNLAKEESKLKDLEKKAVELNEKISEMNRKLQKLNEDFSSKKKEISDFSSNALKRPVLIVEEKN